MECSKCALEANAGDRPSLARFELRMLDEHIPGKGGDSVAAAEDKELHFLSVIDHQSTVAATCLRTGGAKKAISVLRRAYTIAKGHSFPPEPPCRLAMGLVRIQLCVTLSKVGRHEQALREAWLAKEEVDEIWRSLTEACRELEEADRFGEVHRPSPLFRRMLRQPPPWLNRIVEVSVYSRQAMATEMEFLLASDPQSLAGTATSFATFRATGGLESLGEGNEAESAPSEAGASPAPPQPSRDEIDALHEEAERLSRELLPEGHELRDEARRASQQAASRKEELARSLSSPFRKSAILRRSSSLSPVQISRALEEQTTSKKRSAPPQLELPEITGSLRLGDKAKFASPKFCDIGGESLSPPATASTRMPGGLNDSFASVPASPTSPASPWSPNSTWSSSPGATSWAQMAAGLSLQDKVPTMKTVSGHPSGPPGDVRVHSFIKRSLSTPTTFGFGGTLGAGGTSRGGRASPGSSPPSSPGGPRSRGVQRASSRGKAAGSGGNAFESAGSNHGADAGFLSVEQNEPDRSVDPFTDWKNTVVDRSRMTYLQLTIGTLDGQDKVRKEFALENRRFKTIDLNTKVHEELAECRQKYTTSGIAINKQHAKREASYQQKLHPVTSKMEARDLAAKEAWQHYGVKSLDKRPSPKQLRKAFSVVQAKDPVQQKSEWRQEFAQQLKEEERLQAEAEAKAEAKRAEIRRFGLPPRD